METVFQILLVLIFFNYRYLNLVHGIEAPSVYIPNQGYIVGTYLKMFRTQNIKAYLGIRYAEANRFAPPDISRARWTGVFNATTFSPDCWQNTMVKIDRQTENVLNLLANKKRIISYHENCLNLNVFIPDGTPSSSGYAVIVWLHGGDFSTGSAYDVDPFQLVFKQNVIVVTVSYRLSIFGFLSTGDGEAQGNFGLMDQSAALFWINSYINHFGGDSKQITLMGHSSGAVSVGLHLTSGEWSKGAFNKAIMMSGHPFMENIVNLPSKYSDMLDVVSNTFGCIRKPTSMLIQCLRRIDAKTIVENLPLGDWGPVIDLGLSNTSFPFIEEQPITSFKKGNFQQVPLLIGITDMEESLNIPELSLKQNTYTFESFVHEVAVKDFKKAVNNDEWCTNYQIVIDALQYMYLNKSQPFKENEDLDYFKYRNDRYTLAPLYLFLDTVSQAETVFVYKFNIKPQTKFYTLPDWISVPKYFDQVFVWGIPYMDKSNFMTDWNPKDKKISEVVMTLWANFAKSSNPTKTNVYIKWNTYDHFNESILLINDNFHLQTFSKPQIVNFWNSFYPKVMNYAADCCNMTGGSYSNFLTPNSSFLSSLLGVLTFSYFFI